MCEAHNLKNTQQCQKLHHRSFWLTVFLKKKIKSRFCLFLFLFIFNNLLNFYFKFFHVSNKRFQRNITYIWFLSHSFFSLKTKFIEKKLYIKNKKLKNKTTILKTNKCEKQISCWITITIYCELQFFLSFFFVVVAFKIFKKSIFFFFFFVSFNKVFNYDFETYLFKSNLEFR